MKKIWEVYQMIKKYQVSRLASSIAFFFIINGGSLFFLLALTLNIFNIEFKDYVLEANQTLKGIILYFEANANSYYRPFYFVLILTSLWSSSTLFYHIISAGEFIFEVKRKVIPLLYRVISLFFVFIFIALLIIAFIVAVFTSYLLIHLESFYLRLLLRVILYLIIPFFVITFFMLFVPPMRFRMKEVSKGLIFSLAAFLLITIGFRIYLVIFERYKAIYGAFTFIIIAMIYIYLLIIVLLLGLLINMLENRKIKEKKLEKLEVVKK